MERRKKLRRVSDCDPGIRRESREEGFVYLDPEGQEISDPEILGRIRSLAIPPAYSDVWICLHADGHLQATGRDARGRKQYRYHPDWRSRREQSKFGRMMDFGRVLPVLRERVARDIRLPGLPQAKVLATVVRCLEATLIRVGNDDYARTNKSYGLTTLKDRHVDIRGATVRFSFRGKSGIRHRIELRDRTLAGIVQRCRDLPGNELFQYVDRQGRIRDVTSDDVNRYLRACTEGDFTAKDFRTWAGTVLCYAELLASGPADTLTQAKRTANRVLERVAERLGNTPSVCRKSYVHPAVIAAYLDNSLFDSSEHLLAPEDGGLQEDEVRLLMFLERAYL